MKLINSSYEILEQGPGLEGIYEAIETAGRTCYKSERPEGKTAKDFVDMLIRRGHLSPLEHGTVYLTIPYDEVMEYIDTQNPYDILTNPWTKYIINYSEDIVYISTNYRHIVENGLEDWLKYLCEPTTYHEKRVGVRVNCSIGISREWNRHRTLQLTEDMYSIGWEFSVCEQSTRYCNYSKDRFSNELTFVTPSWWYDVDSYTREMILKNLTHSELTYQYLVRGLAINYVVGDIKQIEIKPLTPQQAREVLPLSTATEVVYTGFVSDWSHFFSMRTSILAGNKPHPDIAVLADGLYNEFTKRNYI